MNNTLRVFLQPTINTLRDVRDIAAVCHNSCMSKKGDGGKKPPHDPVAELCGDRLRKCRLARGWSQRELSNRTGYELHKTGLSPQQISNFEQGTRRIGHEEAEILAAAFIEYPSAFFMGTIDEQEARVIAAMRRPELPSATKVR